MNAQRFNPRLSLLAQGNSRTIRSLIRSHFRRYPWPTTAWVVARCIDRNGASVSSMMHKMHKDLEIAAEYDTKRSRVIYSTFGQPVS